MKMVSLPGSGLDGHPVRRAKKDYWCDGWNHKNGHAQINAGQEYVEGDSNIDRAGGFGHYRFCAICCEREIAEAVLE